jgi:hypothetical protein
MGGSYPFQAPSLELAVLAVDPVILTCVLQFLKRTKLDAIAASLYGFLVRPMKLSSDQVGRLFDVGCALRMGGNYITEREAGQAFGDALA